MSKSNFLKGAVVLTIAAFISKVLSALYRIPLQNLSGDISFYVYQQVYPFVGMVIILSLYGFPSAISSLAVKMKGEKDEKLSITRFYIPIFAILFIINISMFFILFVMSNKLSVAIGDSKLTATFQTIAFAFLLIPFVALIRGVFQSEAIMKPTAYSQVADQVVRVSILIFGSYLIYKNYFDLYAIGQFGAIATIVGLIVASLILSFYFFQAKPYSTIKHKIPWRQYIYTLIIFGIVASLNHMILLVVQFADVLTLIPLLLANGFTLTEAQILKGAFDRAQPLIQFGMVVGSSFALALIPMASGDSLHNNRGTVDSLLMSLMTASAATVGLVMLMPEVNTLLFKNSVETTSLRILVGAIFLCSLIITVNALLQSLGLMIRTALFIVMTFFIKIGLNLFFVPSLHLIGSALATIGSLTFLLTISTLSLHRNMSIKKVLLEIKGLRLLFSLSVMVLYLLIVKSLFPFNLLTSRIGLFIYVLFLIITGAFIYLFTLIRLKVLVERQIEVLPFRRILLKFIKG